jgi:hypothetical protein
MLFFHKYRFKINELLQACDNIKKQITQYMYDFSVASWRKCYAKELIGSYTSLYWRSGISFTNVRKDVEFLTQVEEIPDLQ